MNDSLRDLLEQHARGEISLDEALGQIRLLSCRALGDMAKLDTQRANRIGVPEAILAEGMDKDDLAEIGDFRDYEKPEKLAAKCGLVPTVH